MWALVNDRLFNQYIDNRDELVKTLAGVKTELKAPLGEAGKWLLKDENIPLPEGRLMLWCGTVAYDVRLLLSKTLHSMLSTTLNLLLLATMRPGRGDIDPRAFESRTWHGTPPENVKTIVNDSYGAERGERSVHGQGGRPTKSGCTWMLQSHITEMAVTCRQRNAMVTYSRND